MTTIIVASTNPVKIASVNNGFIQMFPNTEIQVEGIAVSSTVSHQPRTNEETERGAVSRVENAKKARPDADYWIGIEGGTSDVPAEFDSVRYKKTDKLGMESFAWVVIESKSGEVGKGKTGTFMLPTKVAELVRSGKELGEADDIVFGQTNSKQKMGAVGLLTNNVIDRETYYTHAVILALIRFTSHNKDLFTVRV
jgi:inosine/xanthosine triphosphatase